MNKFIELIKNQISAKKKKKILAIIRYFKAKKVNISNDDLDTIEKYRAKYPKIFSIDETLELIIKNRASISRFGDAEFDICQFKDKNDPYQKPSEELSLRLNEIIKTPCSDDFLVCIPPFSSSTNNLSNYYGKLSFWEFYWLNRYEEVSKLFQNDSYGNSFVTRESVFHECELSRIKKIWEGRDIVFVYGDNGRFNIKSTIFDNVETYSEIKVKPVNAFDDYESIYNECLNFSTDQLFLIAAGPTATVLAFDLWKRGYQALDIGHLPNSYDEFIGDIISPENIPLVVMKNENG